MIWEHLPGAQTRHAGIRLGHVTLVTAWWPPCRSLSSNTGALVLLTQVYRVVV